ncbi:MAG TPA: hypothetical protein VH142_03385 [Polyangiaceae bacterium]|nr:hypothetical protein [Polyangiaceae bacterium]
MSPADRSVEVVESERVVARGTSRTTWFVRREDEWVNVAQWPGAVAEARNAGPGTVWERAVRVAVPAGTELLRVETAPRADTRQDPMKYLRGSSKGRPTTSRRTTFRVKRDGSLERAPNHAPSRDS